MVTGNIYIISKFINREATINQRNLTILTIVYRFFSLFRLHLCRQDKFIKSKIKKNKFSPSWLIIHIKWCYCLSRSKLFSARLLSYFILWLFFLIIFFIVYLKRWKRHLPRAAVVFISFLHCFWRPRNFECCPDFEVTPIDQWID